MRADGTKQKSTMLPTMKDFSRYYSSVEKFWNKLTRSCSIKPRHFDVDVHASPSVLSLKLSVPLNTSEAGPARPRTPKSTCTTQPICAICALRSDAVWTLPDDGTKSPRCNPRFHRCLRRVGQCNTLVTVTALLAIRVHHRYRHHPRLPGIHILVKLEKEKAKKF